METDDLFSPSGASAASAVNPQAPLATRMRPRTLDEYVGQEHLLGPGKLLRRAIEADRLYSALFHGPPGTGKTSLAEVVAQRPARSSSGSTAWKARSPTSAG